MSNLVFITGHRFGTSFLRGLIEEIDNNKLSLNLSLLMVLHPSASSSVVGYSDSLQIFGDRFQNAKYFSSAKSDQFLADITNVDYNYGFCVGLSQLIPNEIVTSNIFSRRDERLFLQRGWIGAHPTLLPEGRGRAPIPWTILKRKMTTGLTTFCLSAGADDGPILHQSKFTIDQHTTSTNLFATFEQHHCEHGRTVANLINDSILQAHPQDHSIATNWEQRRPSDSFISTGLNCMEVEVMIRSLQHPYPLPFIVFRDFVAHVIGVERVEDNSISQGHYFALGPDRVQVGFADGGLLLRLEKSLPVHISMGANLP